MKDSKLIVALDVATAGEARRLVDSLRDVTGMFKIGSQLFTACGPQFVRELVSGGAGVFLDLKFHDIPNTVAAAGVEAARLGVRMLNLHASGGRQMMTNAVERIRSTCISESLRTPVVVAVTVLTSTDDATLADAGVSMSAEALVIKLARLANDCGLDGIVCSPLEITSVRNAIPAKDFILVTPGVRPAGSAADDQSRITTPAEAIRAGANYIVVGRPITAARDPQAAALAIIDEIGLVHPAHADSAASVSREIGR